MVSLSRYDGHLGLFMVADDFAAQFARQYAAGDRVDFSMRPVSMVRDDKDLQSLESFHSLADTYLWLAMRLANFHHRKTVYELRDRASQLITQTLESVPVRASPTIRLPRHLAAARKPSDVVSVEAAAAALLATEKPDAERPAQHRRAPRVRGANQEHVARSLKSLLAQPSAA